MSAGALDGRVAVVVGASTGIGAATARAFAEAGAHVHAAARRRPSLGAGITGHELDVADRAGVDAFAAALAEPVDAVVIAAGVNLPERALARLTPESWDRLLAVNLTGAFNVVHALLAPLRRAQGDVVLIGSVSGSWPDPSGPGYQAAKAGLLAFGRAAGYEEHDRGVRFTTVLPGVVDTPILDNRPEPPSPELRAHMLQPEDVATDRTAGPLPSSYSSRSSRPGSAASSSASSAALSTGSAFSKAAVICRASGSPPQACASRAADSASELIRSSPGRATRSAASSSAMPRCSSRTVTSTICASRPASMCREVTTTLCGPTPGSNGRTCASDEALSTIASTGPCISASIDRYSPARSSAPNGMCSPDTPSARSRASSACAGSTGTSS